MPESNLTPDELEIYKKLEGMDERELDGLERELQTLEISRARNPLLHYVPSPKGKIFHSWNLDERHLYGGQSGGKSFIGAYETACVLYGHDPCEFLGWRPPPPRRIYGGVEIRTRIWIGSPGFDKGVAMVEVNLLPFLMPGSYEWNATKGVLSMQNGAKAIVMSYEKDKDKWKSDPIDFIWFDEPPPYELYLQGRSRVGRRNGKIIMTGTPSDSNAVWMYYEIFQKGPQLNPLIRPTINYMTVSMWDNPYLTDNMKALLAGGAKGTVHERSVLYGEFDFQEGVIHKQYDPTRHLIPAFPITDEHRRDFQFGRMIDLHGANDEVYQLIMYKKYPAPILYVIRELEYPSGNIRGFKTEINRIERDEFKVIVKNFSIIDTHEAKQGDKLDPTMILRLAEKPEPIIGIPSISRSLVSGVDAFNEYLTNDRFFVFNTCPMTDFSIRNLRWSRWKGAGADEKNLKEKHVAKDDHHVRNVHYACLQMPRITFGEPKTNYRGEHKYGKAVVRNYQKRLAEANY